MIQANRLQNCPIAQYMQSIYFPLLLCATQSV